nr:MAG: hypothetical protein EDM05_22440 [Leptolyngbya sp. IPPAS B-1204]
MYSPMESTGVKNSVSPLAEQGGNVIPLHPEVSAEGQEPQPTQNHSREMDREALVSWLFLIGSLLFTLDSVLENLRGVSFSSLLHISASILFTIGSALFIPSRSQD